MALVTGVHEGDTKRYSNPLPASPVLVSTAVSVMLNKISLSVFRCILQKFTTRENCVLKCFEILSIQQTLMLTFLHQKCKRPLLTFVRYTLFFNAEKDGGPVMKPLWVEFPTLVKTFSIDNSHLVGTLKQQIARHCRVYSLVLVCYWLEICGVPLVSIEYHFVPVGPAVFIHPITEMGSGSVSVYLPAENEVLFERI